MKQLRKRFSQEQVEELLKKYEGGIVKSEIICNILAIARAQTYTRRSNTDMALQLQLCRSGNIEEA